MHHTPSQAEGVFSSGVFSFPVRWKPRPEGPQAARDPGAGIHSGNPTGQPVLEASKPLRTEGLAVLESDIADAAKSNMHGGQGLRYLKNTLETCS